MPRAFVVRHAGDRDPPACRFVGLVRDGRATIELAPQDRRTFQVMHTMELGSVTVDLWTCRPYTRAEPRENVMDLPLGPRLLCYPVVVRATGEAVGTVKQITKLLEQRLRSRQEPEEDAVAAEPLLAERPDEEEDVASNSEDTMSEDASEADDNDMDVEEDDEDEEEEEEVEDDATDILSDCDSD
jgi:hypothetical protein